MPPTTLNSEEPLKVSAESWQILAQRLKLMKVTTLAYSQRGKIIQNLLRLVLLYLPTTLRYTYSPRLMILKIRDMQNY